VVLGVLDNPEKTGLFSPAERVSLLSSAIGDRDDIEIASFSGLAVDFATSVGARWIVRGVRSASDVAYELPMAHSNRLCGAEEIETILILTRPDLAFVSSTLVRQIAAAGGRLERFVPPEVERALRGKFSG
jgi:pantetheine-phosphate adenylyltransferase